MGFFTGMMFGQASADARASSNLAFAVQAKNRAIEWKNYADALQAKNDSLMAENEKLRAEIEALKGAGHGDAS